MNWKFRVKKRWGGEIFKVKKDWWRGGGGGGGGLFGLN